MQYCDKFYEVARPLYDALQGACVDAYLCGKAETTYGTIPTHIYMSDDGYTDLVIEEWGNVQEYFQTYDFDELLPWLLCLNDWNVKGAVKWVY